MKQDIKKLEEFNELVTMNKGERDIVVYNPKWTENESDEFITKDLVEWKMTPETEEYVKKYLDTDEGEVTPKKKRLVIVNDVRIYLNSIKQIVSTIKDVGIPVSMEQDVDGGDVLVTLRIRNTKKPKEPRLF